MVALVRFFPSAYQAFFASFALLLLAACGRGVAVPTEASAVAAGSSISALSTAQSSLAATQADSSSSAAGPSPYAKPPGEATLETAILAGGCFWGMQEILRKIPGVVETEVGYAGGITDGPSYETVHLGTTGHAESVRIRFDPKRLSYSDLLEKWFFRMHDPTTKNRQGNDRGTQYRSAIFYTTPAQRAVAESVKARVDKSGKWHAPIVTEISAAGPFTRAEEYHQDYLRKVPNGYTCHFLRDL